MFSIMTMASSTTKPDRDGQRHQREIVRLKPSGYITAKVPISDSGSATRDDGRPEVAQEKEDHHHHQGDGQDQRELHVGTDGANRSACGRHQDRLASRAEARRSRAAGLDPVDDLGGVGAGLA